MLVRIGIILDISVAKLSVPRPMTPVIYGSSTFTAKFTVDSKQLFFFQARNPANAHLRICVSPDAAPHANAALNRYTSTPH